MLKANDSYLKNDICTRMAFGNKRIGDKKSRFQLNLIKFVNRKIEKKNALNSL